VQSGIFGYRRQEVTGNNRKVGKFHNEEFQINIHQILQDYQLKNEMGGACSISETNEKCTQNSDSKN
jgi:hypothetical protein